MLAYLASFEPEILLAKTFLFMPSRMNKKKERKKSLSLEKGWAGDEEPPRGPWGKNAQRDHSHGRASTLEH